MKKVILFVVLLIAACAATFYYTRQHYKSELDVAVSTREAAIEQSKSLLTDNTGLEAQLRRLAVWEEFGRMQEEVRTIHDEIRRLNFGNALEQLALLEESIGDGAYGETFQDSRDELGEILGRCREELKQTDEKAFDTIVEFNRTAYEVLSGIGAERAAPATSDSAPKELEPVMESERGVLEELLPQAPELERFPSAEPSDD